MLRRPARADSPAHIGHWWRLKPISFARLCPFISRGGEASCLYKIRQRVHCAKPELSYAGTRLIWFFEKSNNVPNPLGTVSNTKWTHGTGASFVPQDQPPTSSSHTTNERAMRSNLEITASRTCAGRRLLLQGSSRGIGECAINDG
jgi:hypothetical protein